MYAAIVKDPETQKILYEVIEPTLQKDELERPKEIEALLMEEVDISLKDIESKEKAEKYLRKKTLEILKKYRSKSHRNPLTSCFTTSQWTLLAMG